MKKRAFTLTELLVVVVIIGVLAAVVLPKFTRVIETRRTTEAEGIMRAVRSEQEARCTLDKSYTDNREELSSWPRRQGSNYTYTLAASGMSATRRNNTYTLWTAYNDGHICCTGEGCDGLGKYDTCTQAYQNQIETESSEWSVPGSPVPPPPPPPVAECPANYREDCPTGQTGAGIFHTFAKDGAGNCIETVDNQCTPEENPPEQDLARHREGYLGLR